MKIDQRIFVSNLLKIILIIYPAIYSSEKKDQLYLSVYKNHIWTKYLKAAGESFEAVMEVK